MSASLVGSEMCIRDSHSTDHRPRTQRPLDGGRRRAQGMWSGLGPGQWAGVVGAHTTETAWPA
eukprot:14895928-Alexandrium_andersonii.AAC.1